MRLLSVSARNEFADVVDGLIFCSRTSMFGGLIVTTWAGHSSWTGRAVSASSNQSNGHALTWTSTFSSMGDWP